MLTDHIQEIQGLYGPFTLTERVIQKIWLRQDYARDGLLTVSGKSLRINDPGRWNLQEGPDFKQACLMIDGVTMIGDVEVHFNVSDWHRHQHQHNTAYNDVVLHVVLHPEQEPPKPVRTSTGRIPELLYLMPVLNQDLESYALHEALMELEQQDELEWVARFIQTPPEQRVRIIQQRATTRWQQKLTYAQARLQAEGWEAACHCYALEVLGYTRNRVPMLRLAARHPLAEWRDARLTADALFAAEAAQWKLNGLRPANHPQRRLAQYLALVRQQPYWPDRLLKCLHHFPIPQSSGSTAAFRKTVELAQRRAALSESVFSGMLGQTRLNTLIVDAILPLATVAGLFDGFSYWMHWPPGDSPAALRRFVKHAGVITPEQPYSNGWNQGALALFVEHGA